MIATIALLMRSIIDYVQLEYILIILRLMCLIYYLISLSYRLCFLEDYNFSRQSAFVIAIDYLIDSFYIIDYFAHIDFKSNTIKPVHSDQPQQPVLVRRRGTVTLLSSPVLKDVKHDKSSPFSLAVMWGRTIIILKYAVHATMMSPFELLGCAVGMRNYQYLRLFRALRCIYLNHYWSQCSEMLRETKLISAITFIRVMYIVLLSMIIIHVSACLYYLIGVSLWKQHHHNWLTEDHLASEESLEFLHTESYRYLRALYWSIESFYSVEYGDIKVTAQSETWYKVFYVYVAVFFQYISVAALIIVIKTNDASRTTNLRNVEIFDHFAKYRKLPDALVHQVHAYYLYQWEALEGVDENQVCR